MVQWFAIGWLVLAPLYAWADIEIRLDNQALKDPLLEFVLPPKGSDDRSEFTPQGFHVVQVGDRPDVATGVSGFKFLANATGDFTFQLEVDIERLLQPSSGWGQGLMIRTLTDDPDQEVMAFGIVATPKLKQAFYSNFSRGEGKNPERKFIESNFQKGVLVVERKAREICFLVEDEESSRMEIFRRRCTTASIQGIHVWCTRQSKGNQAAEYLLKRVKFRSDKVFVYDEQAATSYFDWLLRGMAAAILVTIFLIVRQKFVSGRDKISEKTHRR
jgi:hypothetical protein